MVIVSGENSWPELGQETSETNSNTRIISDLSITRE
jgi:hypothetical protein